MLDVVFKETPGVRSTGVRKGLTEFDRIVSMGKDTPEWAFAVSVEVRSKLALLKVLSWGLNTAESEPSDKTEYAR